MKSFLFRLELLTGHELGRVLAKAAMSTEAIASATGLSISLVCRDWSDYFQDGLAGARGKPKGGRHHQNLTVQEDQALLALVRPVAHAG